MKYVEIRYLSSLYQVFFKLILLLFICGFVTALSSFLIGRETKWHLYLFQCGVYVMIGFYPLRVLFLLACYLKAGNYKLAILEICLFFALSYLLFDSFNLKKFINA